MLVLISFFAFSDCDAEWNKVEEAYTTMTTSDFLLHSFYQNNGTDSSLWDVQTTLIHYNLSNTANHNRHMYRIAELDWEICMLWAEMEQ
ncbi:MAG: hypothetical protein QNK37_27030 [Acidobacteriota bacterium]|nr:hypothetical protein [Acidobacteriota bacterium]